jgi:carboxypeptidase C (cathepsin A)
MRKLLVATIATALTLGLAAAAHAQDDGADKAKPEAAAAKDKAKDDAKSELPPFPADAHVAQVTHVAGKTLNYTATVGSIPVRDEKGKKIAEVVFTAYTLDGPKDPRRPVTFAFNGGPGAASVYLNLGAIGPKHVPFGVAGDSPSDPAVLTDNPGTWLDFTDLVFIDPVGTGFSRSLVDDTESKKHFYGTKQDIEYLSRVVYDWLNKNGRLTSPKYVVGESYGGFRVPRVTHYLQTRLGVGVSGAIMVSPYLDSASEFDAGLSPLPWIINMPAMAAANLERHGELDAAHMAPIIAYARGDYASDLLKGRTDPAATSRVVAQVTQLTGLDPAFVKRSGGRIETEAYLREIHREDGKIGSVYDSNVTAWDPFPYAPDQRANDPILDTTIAPTTSAMVDFDTRVVGWKLDAPFYTLNYNVGRLWNDGHEEQVESVTDLRQAVAIDPKMKVLIAHGWDDLSCPFMASVMIVDQMPPFGDGRQPQVQVKEYPGGHMFYARPESQAAFRKDVMALYGAS